MPNQSHFSARHLKSQDISCIRVARYLP